MSSKFFSLETTEFGAVALQRQKIDPDISIHCRNVNQPIIFVYIGTFF